MPPRARSLYWQALCQLFTAAREFSDYRGNFSSRNELRFSTPRVPATVASADLPGATGKSCRLPSARIADGLSATTGGAGVADDALGSLNDQLRSDLTSNFRRLSRGAAGVGSDLLYAIAADHDAV